MDKNIYKFLERIPTGSDFTLEDAMDLFKQFGRYETEDMSEYIIDKFNKGIIKQSLLWLIGDEKFDALDPENPQKKVQGNLSKGLFVSGNTGTGKTTLFRILNKIIQEEKIKVYRSELKKGINIYDKIDDTDIQNYLWTLSWKTYKASEIRDLYIRTGDLSEILNAKVILIDDLGTEETSSYYMKNELNVLKYILEYRGDRKDLITHITCNYRLTDKRMLEMYGSRAISRLYEMCNFFELLGEDRRKMKSKRTRSKTALKE